MAKSNRYFFWVPNFITALNLISGCLAIFFGIEGQLGWAAVFVGIAALFDFLDGLAARLLHAYSEIGKQLDSLADLVSFGVAPAAMVFTMIELSMFGTNRPIFEIEATPVQWAFLFSSLLVPVGGAFRLAKFNIDTRQNENFLGLPIPANALFFASLGLILELGTIESVRSAILTPTNLLISVLFFPALMVSELPMFSLKFKNLQWQDNAVRYLFLGFSAGLLFMLKWYALPLILFGYIVTSATLYLVRR